MQATLTQNLYFLFLSGVALLGLQDGINRHPLQELAEGTVGGLPCEVLDCGSLVVVAFIHFVAETLQLELELPVILLLKSGYRPTVKLLSLLGVRMPLSIEPLYDLIEYGHSLPSLLMLLLKLFVRLAE